MFSVAFQPDGESKPANLKFTYVNWREEEHVYVVIPEKLELGPYHPHGIDSRPEATYVWALHGNVVTRDGDTRPTMGTRRRTFILEGIREPEWMAS